MADGRLCGKCGKLGGSDYGGCCIHCGRYHGEWYSGFKSLEELETWRAVNVQPEARAFAAALRAERDAEIRASDRELARSLGVADVEAFVDLASGTREP